VFQLKQAVGTALIEAREEFFCRRALESWSADPNIEILGNQRARRLSIISFVIRHGGRYLHYNFVVAVLNDLLGIQARGGCSCAGPYGHQLLGIDLDRSHQFQREVDRGCEGIKPGWTRINLNYFISEAVCDYLVGAVHLVAAQGHKLLPDYRFDPASGLWRHRTAPAEPALRLEQLRYDATGRLRYPHGHSRASEAVLARQLTDARALIACRPDPVNNDERLSGLSEDFESLRWFALPSASLR
jgi:hypothetical protein